MNEPLFPCTNALQTPNPPFWTTKTAVPKFPQNSGSTPTPCLDKAVHVQGAMRQRKLGSHTPPCHRRMVITTLFSVQGGAMRQRKLGSHTPPCHRRMVMTTLFSVLLAALQRRPVLYHTRWLLAVHWHCSSGHRGQLAPKVSLQRP